MSSAAASEFEHLKLSLEAWKTTVDVQKHFNELSMQVRRTAVTVLLAIGAGVGIALEKELEMLALGLHCMALVGWVLFWYMERQWAHQLLLGAVRHGLEIERQVGEALPAIRLATTIRARISERQAWVRGHAFYATVVLLILGAHLLLWLLA